MQRPNAASSKPAGTSTVVGASGTTSPEHLTSTMISFFKGDRSNSSPTTRDDQIRNNREAINETTK